MSKINDGGPAFPGYAMEDNGTTVRIDKLMPGMTLRDYFAAKAIGPLLADTLRQDRFVPDEVVVDAFRLADAAPKARSANAKA